MTHEMPHSKPHSEIPTEPLTLKQAAARAGCSVSLVRKLVRADEVPSYREQTKRGFRYVIPPEALPVLAHRVAMRKPGVIRAPAPDVLDSRHERSQTTPDERLELERLRTRNELLGRENARLWQQVSDLTATVSRLALPVHQSSPEPAPGEGRQPELAPVPRSGPEADEYEKGAQPTSPQTRVLDAGSTVAMVVQELRERLPTPGHGACPSPLPPTAEPHWTLKIAEAMNPDLRPRDQDTAGSLPSDHAARGAQGLSISWRRFWRRLLGPNR